MFDYGEAVVEDVFGIEKLKVDPTLGALLTQILPP